MGWKKYSTYRIVNQIIMPIFNKENGTLLASDIPFNNKKKFLDMSKINTNNPVLQRNGAKSSYALIINKLQTFTNDPGKISVDNIFNINILTP
jgi:hypothetical protein